ncbi:MAG TPA: carbohydrate porin [Terriglobales bacterium]|nr:carbohydrate porin [Terriglobales bacterium]
MFPHNPSSRFWLSGQANFIFQTHPPFDAKYSGPNSLHNTYEKATSRVLTLYTGVRLNSSAELLFDIEESGGQGLSNALGMAGFTNLDVVRNPTIGQAPYIARGIFHYVFALSEERVEVDRNPLSGFAELPLRRVEIRFGKFSTADFFDLNSVGTDSHFQFMNWTIDNNGAYDYAADTRGYTIGLIAEYQNPRWGFRFGELLLPKLANGIDLQWNLRKAHAENFEFELRKQFLPHLDGIIRILSYINTANMGIYRVQNQRFLDGLDPTPDITNHPPQTTRKYGFGFNFEQSLNSWIRGFGRFGWNNGKTESFAYTEVDQTVLFGVGFAGSRWKRRLDRAGVAFVSNGICHDHSQYLALGGLGFILGDGALTYGREKILESYYTAHVWRGIYLGPAVQYATNPGYNKDRGPVVVPGFRLHLEF